MEIVGTDSGAFNTLTALPEQHKDQQIFSLSNMTSDPLALTTPIKQNYGQIDIQSSAWLDTPANVHVANHFEPSNVRGNAEQDPEIALPKDVRAGATQTSSRLPEGSLTPKNTTPNHVASRGIASESRTPSNAASFGMEQSSTNEATEAEQLTRAYAMIKFRDSHCYITTPNLVIVRDLNFLQDWQAHEKERKRRAKAQEALQQYALEPSQPSQPGDDDRHDPSSRSGDSLVGRPERGLLSHYSEQGGPVAYALSDEEEEIRSTQRKRRILRTLQNSSSANSVAPHNLHPNEGSEFLQTGQHFDSDGHPSDPFEWAQLPVHPPKPEDIKKISREHLIFTYNSDSEQWELKVIGNRAFVNGTLYDKHDVVPLSHNDEIIITSLTMNFVLPDDLIKDTDSDAAGDDIIESVEADSRLNFDSDGMDAADDDSDDDGNEGTEDVPKRGRIKIKLNFKKDHAKDITKGKGKGKGKSNKKADEKTLTASASPEATKKAAKVRKPSDAVEEVKKESSVPPALPLNLDPNSTLAGLAPDELPEKRKGPGRPPKNGLVSKRDEAIIRKKIKDYEKKGLPVPEYRVLLEETRNENRQRDLANKARAGGEPVPDIPTPTLENLRPVEPGQAASQPAAEGKAENVGSSAVPERKSSPKPRKVVRTPSPIKPESEFTEEELKKPNITYIYILDEILQNVEGGVADLQTIYDKIQKRWPHYRYRVPSSGWQSSVRHNLLSSERFIDAGKSGKGKFWKINDKFPLDKSKRKPSPPATRPPTQNIPNGQGPPPQWQGPPPYNGPYSAPNLNSPAQPPPNPGTLPANGTYCSPYGPSQSMPPGSQHPAVSGYPGSAPQMRQPPIPGPYPRNGSHVTHPSLQNGISHRPPVNQQPQSQTSARPAPFQPVVDAIMNYRTEFLSMCVPDSDEFRQFEDRFRKGTQYFSNLFHRQANVDMSGEDLTKEPFSRIAEIFERFEFLFSAPQQNDATASARNPSAPSPASGPSQLHGKAQPGTAAHNLTANAGQQPAVPGTQSTPVMGAAAGAANLASTVAPMIANTSTPAPVLASNVSATAPAASMVPALSSTESVANRLEFSVQPSPTIAGEPTSSSIPPGQQTSTTWSQEDASSIGRPGSVVTSPTIRDIETTVSGAQMDNALAGPPTVSESPPQGLKRAADDSTNNDEFNKRVKTE